MGRVSGSATIKTESITRGTQYERTVAVKRTVRSVTKVREADILKALSKKHDQNDAFFTHVKNGRTQAAQTGELAIIDAVAIAKSWARPVIRGYEVKVERSDFLRDIKWHKYFDMCHEFSFVCPVGMIQPEELPAEAGLIYYNPEKQSLYTKKKSVYRSIEMPVDMLWYIIISQAKSDRHPFYSSTREYLQAWVEDKEDRQKLGGWVSEKLQRIAEKIPTLERSLEREKATHETTRDIVDKANKVLRPYGIQLSTWGSWSEELSKLLQAGGAPNLQKALQLAKSLERELSEMQERLQ